MLSEFDIRISKEAREGRVPAALDKVLTKRRLRDCLEQGPLIGRGVTSDVYLSASELSIEERSDLRGIMGRWVYPPLVVKVAKVDKGVTSSNNVTCFRREVYMSSRPEVQPFAVATSSVMSDPNTGRAAIIEEMAYDGIDVRDKEEVSAKIDETHLDRIGFQLALIYQIYRDYGASAQDIGKDFFYVVDALPPRILLYDLSFFKEAREVNIRGENNDFALNLRMHLLKNVNPDIRYEKHDRKTWLLQMIQNIESGKYYRSFGSFAKRLHDIGEFYGNDFAGEYRQTTGRDPDYGSSL